MPIQPHNFKQSVRQEKIINYIKTICQRKTRNDDYGKGYRDLAECILAVIDDNMEEE